MYINNMVYHNDILYNIFMPKHVKLLKVLHLNAQVTVIGYLW